MPDVNPTQVLPGYELLAANDSAPAAGIFIPLSSLSGLTTAEANETTGDGRKVAFEICRSLFGSINGLQVANRPVRFTVARATPTGVSADIVRQAYTLTFDLSISGSDVAPES